MRHGAIERFQHKLKSVARKWVFAQAGSRNESINSALVVGIVDWHVDVVLRFSNRAFPARDPESCRHRFHSIEPNFMTLR